MKKRPCQISYWFAAPENQNIIGGKPKRCTEKARNGGVYPHAIKHTIWWRGSAATKRTIRWRGTTAVPPTLCLEQWHKIGGMSIPCQQRQKSRAINGIFCTSVLLLLYSSCATRILTGFSSAAADASKTYASSVGCNHPHTS
jgi:hypothetical protein